MFDPLSIARALVALPSVNPLGRDVFGSELREARVTEYLQQCFTELGVPWARQTVERERDNIVACLDGAVSPQSGGPVLMLEAHQDTVPVDGMTIDPYGAAIREGRLYGRGACDVKGGMAAMLAAFARLARERPAGMATLLMAATVNEEQGFTGATLLNQLWNDAGGIFPRRPDAVVVAEPTGLDVVVAHKGVVRWRCRTTGRAVHSSRPELGENAIFRMAPVLAALEQYQRDIAPNLGSHPLCGRPTLSVGTIAGGLTVNTVPDHCVIEIDRRLLPDELPDKAMAHVVEHLSTFCGTTAIGHDKPFLMSCGLSDRENGRLAAQFAQVAEAHGGRGRRVGVPYGTDASAYARAGVPSVVFGPGSIEQAHTADEWVEIDQLRQASEILFDFARHWTG
jgi:acetylornithine deacetylase